MFVFNYLISSLADCGATLFLLNLFRMYHFLRKIKAIQITAAPPIDPMTMPTIAPAKNKLNI
jgi:hypothetical protein